VSERKTYPRPADDAIIVCKTCQKELPAIEFATSKVQPGGIRVHCKACWKAKRSKKKATGGARSETVERPKGQRTSSANISHQPVKLPGRKSGWACKIFHRRTHVATTSKPEGCPSRESAIDAAYAWEREWAHVLIKGKS